MKQSPKSKRSATSKSPKAKASKKTKPEKQKKTVPAKAKNPAAKKLPATDTVTADKPSKGRQLLADMLSRDEGATLDQMAEATGWQRGAVSGTMSKIKKLLAPRNLAITSHKDAGGKAVYKITQCETQENAA